MTLRQDAAGWYWPSGDRHACRVTPKEVSGVPRYMEHVPAAQRRLCVQAGGNVGMFPLALSAYFEQVWTAEPDPETYAALEANTLHVSNLCKLNVALGARCGTAGVYRRPHEADNYGATRVDEKGEGIKIISLDSLALRSLDLLMLDVEGFEFPALAGAEATIEEHRPVIALELKGTGEPRWPDEVIRGLLRTWGYRRIDVIGRDEVWKSRS